MLRFYVLLLSLGVFSMVQAAQYTEIEFQALLPKDDFQALLNPPAFLFDIEDGSFEDQIASSIQNPTRASQSPLSSYEQALRSTRVIDDFNNQKIRIAGFIVPLEFDDQYIVTEFLLVPYFGACIHLPPPPPNQIIFMQSKKGVLIENIYDPFWVEGTLTAAIQTNDIATSAYRMQVDAVKSYLND